MAKQIFNTTTRRVTATPRSKRLRAGGHGASAGVGMSAGQTAGYIDVPEDRGKKYVHMKFSDVENPSTEDDLLDTPSTYVGVYIDNDPVSSTDPTRYQWLRFQGEQGEKGEPGKEGTDGRDGLMVYPAGEYDMDTTYSSEGETTPVVMFKGEYYMLRSGKTYYGREDPYGTETPADDVGSYGDDSRWIKVDRFNSIFADIVMVDFAKLGSAVFYGDWMISQHGIRDGAESSEYQYFKDGTFAPNFAVNFKTGETRIGSGKAVIVIKNGKVTCHKMESTEAMITSGKIAGFNIDRDFLTNEGMNNDATIIMQNVPDGTYAGIGPGVLPPSNGETAVARFENTPPEHLDPFEAPLYGIQVKASGRAENIALSIGSGFVEGMAMRNTIIDPLIRSWQLKHRDYNVIALNTDTCDVTLPEMGPADDGHVIRIKRLGAGLVRVYARANYTIQNAEAYLSVPPIIVGANEHVLPGWPLNVESAGDSMELVWVRDIARTIDGTKYYGAWVQYKMPRDW